MASVKGLTIKSKAILIAMVCSITALLTSVLFSDIYENHKSQQQMKGELTAIATILAERSTAAIQFGDESLAQLNLAALKNASAVELGCLYDQNGVLFASYKKQTALLENCPPSNNQFKRHQKLDHMHINQPVILDDTEIGVLHICASLVKLEKLLALYLLVNLGFGSIAAVIALILAARLQNFITKPINNLRETAADIEASHNFSLRAEKLSNDEVGELVLAFNNMLDRIESENKMLSESESRFRTLTSSSPFGVFQTDNNGDYVYVNDCWRDMTRIHELEIKATDFTRVLHPEERCDTENEIREAQKNGYAFKSEFRLLHEDGQIINAICQAKPIFDSEGKLRGFIGSLVDVSELKDMQEQLEKLALYDPLTHLANRRLFRDRLEKTIKVAQRNQTQFGLMFLDFDHFKKINDTLGHDQGDELLVTMAKRLLLCIRPGDTLSRLGGDEFTILIPEIGNHHDVDVIARKILKVISKPIVLDGQEVIATCSIGITLYPEDATESNVLMKNADMAMYQSKDSGRNRFHYFSQDMNEQIKKQLRIENDLRRALEQNEFELFFQPKIELDNEQLIGYEALIRWNHPETGLVSPADFIPVAEETGLISKIGSWVLQDVCDKIPEFISQGVLPENSRIAINLSAKQFRDPDLVQEIRDTLQKKGVSPRNLELEITESLIMNDINSAIETLNEFRSMGIALSIDDFGTGYSSFNYLKRLPIDYIKIDRSFVMDIPDDRDDMEITSAIIAMAHSLRLKVVAEGLETEEQKEFLRKHNCDVAQGYLFGRPAPANKLPRLPVKIPSLPN